MRNILAHIPSREKEYFASRLNREIRRRTNGVGVFPNQDSYIRLVTSYLMEYHEDWSAGRSYINPIILQQIQEQRKAV